MDQLNMNMGPFLIKAGENLGKTDLAAVGGNPSFVGNMKLLCQLYKIIKAD